MGFVAFEEEVSTKMPVQLIEPYDEDVPIIPKWIGFCSNIVEIRFLRGQMVPIPCCRSVDDQDIEAVELPQKGNRRQFVCGPCVEKLLAAKVEIDIDIEKPKRSRQVPGIHKEEEFPL